MAFISDTTPPRLVTGWRVNGSSIEKTDHEYVTLDFGGIEFFIPYEVIQDMIDELQYVKDGVDKYGGQEFGRRISEGIDPIPSDIHDETEDLQEPKGKGFD